MVDFERREFVKKSAATITVTTACLCGLGACAAYTGISKTPAAAAGSFTLSDGTLIIDLEKEPALQQIGGAVKILDAGLPDGLIIARVAENRYETASLHCTHRGVELEYDHGKTRFQCPSIGSSAFALDGTRVSGPARRSLVAYDSALDGDKLTIRL